MNTTFIFNVIFLIKLLFLLKSEKSEKAAVKLHGFCKTCDFVAFKLYGVYYSTNVFVLYCDAFSFLLMEIFYIRFGICF